MMRALLIRHPHIDKILDRKKTWEIRGSRSTIRGTIALIPSGSGTIAGVCELTDCIGPLTPHSFKKNARKAGIRPCEAQLGWYRQTFAWVVKNARWLQQPVPYNHPSGVIIWVNLPDEVERRILKQLPTRSS